MPPLSLTQSKYALAMFAMSVKSVPGCLVTIAPSLIGSPVAFWPLPLPHLGAVVESVVVPGPLFELQAASAVEATSTSASRANTPFLRISLPPSIESISGSQGGE